MADHEAEEGSATAPQRTDPLVTIRERGREVVATGDPVQIKALYAEFSDLLHDTYGDDADGVPVLSRPETLAAISRLMGDARGLVLDAGCGPNPVAALALGGREDRSVVGLDIGLGTVRLARMVAARAGIEILPVVGDLEALPFAAGTFGSVVCDDTIEHVPDDARSISELARVLRPRGRMVLATPNRWNIDVLVRKLSDRLHRVRRPASAYYATTSHLREYRWTELSQLLDPLFSVRRRASVGWQGGRKRRLATRIVGLPMLRNLDQMLVVEAEVR
ncbi:MAG: class I SAM-dependent methyltransferase [Actinomycetota bacterium]